MAGVQYCVPGISVERTSLSLRSSEGAQRNAFWRDMRDRMIERNMVPVALCEDRYVDLLGTQDKG